MPMELVPIGQDLNTRQQEPPSRSLVIVVDDDAAVRSSLMFSLDIEGYAVRVYSNAMELLTSTELQSCACLIVDQRLPGLTGLELLALLRARHVLAPAILITTYPDEALRKGALAAHVQIVEKPLMENTLLECLRNAVRGGGRTGLSP